METMTRHCFHLQKNQQPNNDHHDIFHSRGSKRCPKALRETDIFQTEYGKYFEHCGKTPTKRKNPKESGGPYRSQSPHRKWKPILRHDTWRLPKCGAHT